MTRSSSSSSIGISIHALREEGDPVIEDNGRDRHISIHALREEGDQTDSRKPMTSCTISIHALREEGDGQHCCPRAAEHISIHALREEGDEGTAQDRQRLGEFLSTPSARRATCTK